MLRLEGSSSPSSFAAEEGSIPKKAFSVAFGIISPCNRDIWVFSEFGFVRGYCGQGIGIRICRLCK